MTAQLLYHMDWDIFGHHKTDTGTVVYLPEDFQFTIVFPEIIGMGHRQQLSMNTSVLPLANEVNMGAMSAFKSSILYPCSERISLADR